MLNVHLLKQNTFRVPFLDMKHCLLYRRHITNPVVSLDLRCFQEHALSHILKECLAPKLCCTVSHCLLFFSSHARLHPVLFLFSFLYSIITLVNSSLLWIIHSVYPIWPSICSYVTVGVSLFGQSITLVQTEVSEILGLPQNIVQTCGPQRMNHTVFCWLYYHEHYCRYRTSQVLIMFVIRSLFIYGNQNLNFFSRWVLQN